MVVQQKPVAQEQRQQQLNTVATSADEGIPSIYDLSVSLQKAIPATQYGAHVYATDNRSGFVILNGSKYKAQSKMRNGVFIETVGEGAVVLSYQGVVFSLLAMKSWKAP